MRIIIKKNFFYFDIKFKKNSKKKHFKSMNVLVDNIGKIIYQICKSQKNFKTLIKKGPLLIQGIIKDEFFF
ncbi:hypothetical protein CM15mP37_10470 [bacterium]|nr:MAG: hypothetical protein CM15mP37_10470 [bacterium]